MAKKFDQGQELLRHLDAGYNLARWLLKNDQDARDVVQDSFVRALRFDGEVINLKAWFLTIVRNVAYTALKKRLALRDEKDQGHYEKSADPRPSPEEVALQMVDVDTVRAALLNLNEQYREIFVLREMEELSYQELAEILDIPAGTVMSRLARARRQILDYVHEQEQIISRKDL